MGGYLLVTTKPAMIKKKQNILTGSSYLIDRNKVVVDREVYMLENMSENKAYLHALSGHSSKDSVELLKSFKVRYAEYRRLWFDQSKECFSQEIFGPGLIDNGYTPLCIDIETASICDLACPFCYRESLATPDKIISEKLFRKIIDQASNIGVPSIKLNWRGEPLMHPKLPKMIEYAKSKGILEVIINTNATHLSSNVSQKLINAGLDLMIYSFDGGSKETYERMRPGRFKENSFDAVYGNIMEFSRIRKKNNAKFPRTKIQMILTKETHEEQDSFFNLFNDYVDEVTVTQYSERGGNVADLSELDQETYVNLCRSLGVSNDAPYLRNAEGEIGISDRRIPCEQPYQRMLVTYDGRVAMCCYDWGAMQPIGYVSEDCFKDQDADKKLVMKRIDDGRKGFELLSEVSIPPKFNQPTMRVQTLSKIWEGREVEKVREKHGYGQVDQVNICKKCPFKDTYHWVNS